MRTSNKIKFPSRLLASLLIAVFVFTPFGFENLKFQKTSADIWTDLGFVVINQDTVWHKTDNLSFSKTVVVTNGATLTIEPGSVVKFSNSQMYGPSVLNVSDGRIIANGTQEEKIVFMPNTNQDRFGISFRNGPEIKPSSFRFVEISKGGYQLELMMYEKPKSILRSAFANANVATLEYFSGKLHIENSKFLNSYYSDIDARLDLTEDNSDDYLEVVNSNFQGSLVNQALDSEVYCELEPENCLKSVLLKNNWYGDMLGPNTPGSMVFSMGEKISGGYLLEGWRSNDLIADPVVIVPGITGSEKFLGKWKLDPITHSYDDLFSSFKNNGYESGVNLFDFPYDWRNNNATTARQLQSRIEGIISGTKVSRVDVVAHSMGGLVARAYVEEISGAIYNDTIDELITLGTPHKGSPASYLKWEAGEGFFTWNDKLAKYHFKQEAEEAGYTDLQSYIKEKIPSVKELLPDYDYLFDISQNQLRSYPENYPRNTFLEELNTERNLGKMQKVRFVNIVGNLGVKSTISKISVINSLISGKWADGMPENFYDSATNRGLEKGNGDETVPISSAEGISADKEIVLDASHSELPTKAQCKVFKELTGRSECEYDENWHITNFLLFNVFSPIDIQIVSPSGKRIGKDFATGEIINEIEGAFYSGFDTENEFVTIPNPEDGEYRILTQTAGEGGEYRIEVIKLAENPIDPQETIESVVKISGTAIPNENTESKIQVEENSVIDLAVKVIEDENPPVIPPVQPPAGNQNGGGSGNVSVGQVSQKKDTKKHHKKKKKKSHKKTKKYAKGVIKRVKQKNTVVKNFGRVLGNSKKMVQKKSETVWKSTTNVSNRLKSFFTNPFGFFRK